MKNIILLSVSAVMFFVFNLNEALAIAYSCDANCDEAAKFRYRCPTINNPNRKCDGTNHVKRAACITDKTLSCDLWDSVKDGYMNNVVNSVAKNDTVIHAAERDGWTKSNCRVSGTGIIGLTAQFYSSPICAAAGVTTAGVGAPYCIAFIAASSALIAEGVCTQLCHDKHLLDCN